MAIGAATRVWRSGVLLGMDGVESSLDTLLARNPAYRRTGQKDQLNARLFLRRSNSITSMVTTRGFRDPLRADTEPYSDTAWYLGVVNARVSRAERQLQTRAELIDAAADLFARRGVDRSSVEAIAEHAGYSRGAYHSNFSSRDELMGAVADLVVRDLAPALDEILKSARTSTERLTEYIRAFTRYCESEPVRTRALVAVVAHRSVTGGPDYESLLEQSLEPLIALFVAGQNAGELRAFDAAVMAEMVRRTLDGVALRIANGAPARELADELAVTFDRATRAD